MHVFRCALFCCAAIFLCLTTANAQQKSLFDNSIVQTAEAYEAYLAGSWNTQGKDAKGWRAEGQKALKADDPRSATRAFASAAVLDKNNADTWLKLGQAYLAIETDKYGDKINFAKNAGSAGYFAFQRAKTNEVRAAALAVVAQSLTAREQWKPALQLYKASLALVADETIQAEYDQVFNEHGFRMLDYTSDNESASPRVCIQFSDTLAKGRTDFANFVTVNSERPASVRVNGQQLCVEELLHGKRYDIRVRSGIASTDGDLLPKPVELTVYIRDRKPSVRFTAKNYVLPRTGQQGIPIVSVNTKAVKATIYRIGDRRLANEVLDGDFAKQLEFYQISELASTKGEKLWSGQMSVSAKLNEEATTAFPVDQLLPDLKPGLYIMTANAAEEDASASKESSEDYATKATQWFVVSDLGLTAFSGADGVTASIRSLATAAPMAGVEVRLVARNNEVLGTAKSDEDGFARFDAALARGTGGVAPALVVARTDQDYGFLDLTKQAFDLSDRGVAGRIAPQKLDAFVFTERGVYRSGETVRVTALLRDNAANAAPNVPLILKVMRPDGVEDRKETLPDQGNGGRVFNLALAQTAMTGTWRIAAYVDPKGRSLYERTFLVEDYVPERLEMKLKAAAPVISRAAPGAIQLTGRYLYGAPASNLGLEGEVVISAVRELPQFPGFQMGQQDEAFANVRKDLDELPTTDQTGAATVSVPLPEIGQTSRPLKADVTLRLRETSGRALADRLGLAVNTGKSFVGVKPLFDGSVPDGTTAAFEVISIAADGKQAALTNLKWEVQRIESRFQYYQRNGRWSYEQINYETRVGSGTLATKADGAVRIEVPATPGQYRLDIVSPTADGPATSLTFYAGYYASDASDVPELLDLALDKPAYLPGDTVTVRILPRMAGKALVSIVSDRVLATKLIDVDASGGSASFTMDASWGPGAYAMAQVYRPLDSAAKRMPSRALGIKWVPLDTKPRSLSVAFETPQTVRPGGPVKLVAAVNGLSAGEKANLVVSGVDVGILNLTRFKTPQPGSYFLGQRQLGLEIRDIYGKLIDGMQGVRGTIRSGGDGGGLALGARPSAEKPLAVFSGLVETDAQGKATVSFDLPPFNGTMRLAAQAWTADRIGHGEQDVIVRDTVVAQATLPKFLVLGDTSRLHLDLENVEAPEGAYRLSAVAEGGLKLTGPADRSITLDRNKRVTATLPLQGAAVGEGKLSFVLSGPGNTNIQRDYTLTIDAPAPDVKRRVGQTLASNATPLRVDASAIKDLVPSTAQVSVAASRTAGLDVPGLLLSLDRYPYGCAEQTTSRALPLLYYNEVAAKARIGRFADAKPAIEKAIARLYEMQSSSGGFSLWGGGGYDPWLTAYIADFFVRAREKGFTVRDLSYDLALERLKNAVNNAKEFESGGEDLAYSLYVLARAGRGVLGDLRYYADTKINAFSTPLAKAQLGAALAMLGDKERAERAFQAAVAALNVPPPATPLPARNDYGTELRDSAAVLALIGESGVASGSISKAAATVSALRSRQRDTTTQESLWLLLAARTLEAQNKSVALDVNGKPVAGAFQTVLSGNDIANGSVRILNAASTSPAGGASDSLVPSDAFNRDGLQIANRGQDAVQASVLVTGDGVQPEAAAESGFKIVRKVYAPDGRELDFDRVKQNDRIVVVLKAKEIDPKLGQIVVEDRLPAGFDIENPALLRGSDLKAFSWLPSTYSPTFTAFRDDRFVAAFTLSDTGRKTPAELTMAYVMRAVTPGTYTHSGAKVEDMYRADRFARTAGSKVEVVAAQ
jgi:uncharacterized protein YfaS (alpha-2-macroglobulin family)